MECKQQYTLMIHLIYAYAWFVNPDIDNIKQKYKKYDIVQIKTLYYTRKSFFNLKKKHEEKMLFHDFNACMYKM